MDDYRGKDAEPFRAPRPEDYPAEPAVELRNCGECRHFDEMPRLRDYPFSVIDGGKARTGFCLVNITVGALTENARILCSRFVRK